MSTIQWILNCTLLGWVLMRNVGTRPVTRGSYLTPLAVVVVAGVLFLRHLPTAGNDLLLESVGLVCGATFGILATALTRVRHAHDGTLITAGVAFAALWIAVIGGRIAFAEWANGAGARTVGEFSVRHQITGADAWTAAFVLRALAMVAARLLSTAGWIRMQRAAQPLAAALTPA